VVIGSNIEDDVVFAIVKLLAIKRWQGEVRNDRHSGAALPNKSHGFDLRREVAQQKAQRRYIERPQACEAASSIEEGLWPMKII
jgi:hypothetical protein